MNMEQSSRNIVYLKGEVNTEVYNQDVVIEDVLEVECVDVALENKIGEIPILQIPKDGETRFVISILRVIECIHEEFPEVEVINEGESDLIINFVEDENQKIILQIAKISIVAGITFIGAAFSIMAFNNDISLTTLFSQIYELIMGHPSDGFTILEFTYSIGLIVGILVFFNHFGKKRFSMDPTPMEVEMRTYEKEIDETIIDNYSRKEKEIDVGQATTSGSSGN